MASEIKILSEIAAKQNILKCICKNTGDLSNIIVENYQPLSCSGDPIGPEISVMPTIVVAKVDTNICNIDELAAAIDGGSSTPYNTPQIGNGTSEFSISEITGYDATKLHTVSFSVTGEAGGTVDMSGDLGGGMQLIAGVPVGFSDSIPATTVFGTGDLTFSNFSGAVNVIVTLIQSA